jgi:hypothetical protein
MMNQPPPRSAQARANPLPRSRSYYFTFGPDHVLRNGRIHHADPELGGMSLGGYFVLIGAPSEAEARAIMVDVFGSNWSGVHEGDRGRVLIGRYELRQLFGVYSHHAFNRVKLCTCGTPGHPHGVGWHTDQEDQEEG